MSFQTFPKDNATDSTDTQDSLIGRSSDAFDFSSKFSQNSMQSTDWASLIVPQRKTAKKALENISVHASGSSTVIRPTESAAAPVQVDQHFQEKYLECNRTIEIFSDMQLENYILNQLGINREGIEKTIAKTDPKSDDVTCETRRGKCENKS
eukprot:60546_1